MVDFYCQSIILGSLDILKHTKKMSYDLGIFRLENKITNQEASNLYAALCEGETSNVLPSPAIDAFYNELTSKHPEIDDIPEEEIDNTDLCPWSIAFDRSPGHLIVSCVWSKAEYVYELVAQLARKHGLAIYNPQTENIFYDDGTDCHSKPWWKVW